MKCSSIVIIHEAIIKVFAAFTLRKYFENMQHRKLRKYLVYLITQATLKQNRDNGLLNIPP